MHAPHDETAQRRKMPPRAPDRIDDEMLALPVLDVSDDADQRHVGRNAELAPYRPSTPGREGGAIDAVEDGAEPARPEMLLAAVRLDLLGHADAGIHPARQQARERAEGLEAFLVADDRQATQLRRYHPVELCAKAVGQVDEVGPFAAVELRERACPRPERRVEVAGVPERTGDDARARSRPPAGKRREDVDGEPVGIDAFVLEERQDGSEPRAVEARDQVEDAGQRAADDAAGARLDEQDAAC